MVVKQASLVGDFLYQQYGIKLKNIGSKLRATLLDEVEHIACNLCGCDDPELVAKRDKYGLPLTTVMCRHCGLLYLDPRPTAKSYQRFYEGGGERESAYHRRIDFDAVEDLLKIYYGPDFVMDDAARVALDKFIGRLGHAKKAVTGPSNSDEARRPMSSSKVNVEERVRVSSDDHMPEMQDEALQIYGTVKGFIPRGSKVFEVGASGCKKLLPWRELHGCEVTGVEPKKKTVMEAKERYNIDLIQGFASDPRIPENAYDLVLNIRTINHMLDPISDLRHAWRWLKLGGVLYVDIEDAIAEARDRPFEAAVIQIDHTYMFSSRTLAAMVQKAGFKILHQEMAHFWVKNSLEHQIRIVAEKSLTPVSIDWPSYTRERAALEWARLRCIATGKLKLVGVWLRATGKGLRNATKQLYKAGKRSRKRATKNVLNSVKRRP